jgi:MoaA/NifB/PqqE/SkfB family radical SAM enzyme
MISYADIRNVHVELSSLCNARCPLCPRNLNGYPYNNGYTEANLTLESVKKIFTPDLLQQLTSILINGNFGDMVMNPETLDIVEYFRSQNPRLSISISTNGSARTKEFWTRLAELRTTVWFCLEGLEDTHHIYRQNTSWSAIIENAKTYIAAGGRAIWKMIKFNHNLHQIDACKQMSKDLGFAGFELHDHGRNSGPVYDKEGKLVYVMGDYTGETNFEVFFDKKRTDMVLVENVAPTVKRYDKINCYTKKNRSIYISSTGDVYPCCWTGFSPKTYGKGGYLEAVNAQLAPLINNNNAIEHGLAECIAWFNAVEASWAKDTFEDGRLICCNDNCGIR